MKSLSKSCIACDEEIHADAKLCKHCKTLQDDLRFASRMQETPTKENDGVTNPFGSQPTLKSAEAFVFTTAKSVSSINKSRISLVVATIAVIFVATIAFTLNHKSDAYQTGWDGNIGVTASQIEQAGGAKQYCESVASIHSYSGSEYEAYIQGCQAIVQQTVGDIQDLPGQTGDSTYTSDSSNFVGGADSSTDAANDANPAPTSPSSQDTTETETKPVYWKPTAVNIIKCASTPNDTCLSNQNPAKTFGNNADDFISQLVAAGLCSVVGGEDQVTYYKNDPADESACTIGIDGDWIDISTIDDAIAWWVSPNSHSGPAILAVGDGWVAVTTSDSESLMRQVAQILQGRFVSIG